MELKLFKFKAFEVFEKIPCRSGSGWLPLVASALPVCSPTLAPTVHSIRVPARYETWCLVLIHFLPALAQPNVANEFIGYLDFLLCDLFRLQETGQQYNYFKFMSQNWEIRGPADKGN